MFYWEIDGDNQRPFPLHVEQKVFGVPLMLELDHPGDEWNTSELMGDPERNTDSEY